MPHIIAEYSNDVADHINMPRLLKSLHKALANEGIDETRIKTRGISLPCAVVGTTESNGHMLHLTLLLLEGRDTATKQQYGSALHALAKEAAKEALPNCAVTLEVRDMQKETYFM